MKLVEKIDWSRNHTENEQLKSLRFFAGLPISERLKVMNYHRNYYLTPQLTDTEKSFLKSERKKNPVQLDYDFLILAIADYKRDLRRNGKSAEIIAEVKEQARRSRIEKLRKDTFIIRLRGIFSEVTHLREIEKLSWTQIAIYLRRAHRKYFGNKAISPDYLRRAYNKLRQEKEDRQNLRSSKKMLKS